MTKQLESVRSMSETLPSGCGYGFSDPAGSGQFLGDAARDGGQRAVIAIAVRGRGLARELGEAGAERPERRAADGQADLGDRLVAPAQQRLGPLDAPRHEVRVRGLAVGGAELP